MSPGARDVCSRLSGSRRRDHVEASSPSTGPSRLVASFRSPQAVDLTSSRAGIQVPLALRLKHSGAVALGSGCFRRFGRTSR